MTPDVKESLVRIETKVDTIITQQTAAVGRQAVTETDMVWVKGGLTIVLTIILSCAGWLAMQYFEKH